MTDNLRKALRCARGDWQRMVVLGQTTYGGSELRGKASTYKSRYVASASHLIDRLNSAGVVYRVVLGPRGGFHCARLVVE